ncbi:MAG: PilZ domain-containing protein [Candidatus Omnitrophica bacterium]|nr:PilZ domain-containing protein [Candidatus Omnitrophota bacterium]
MDKTGTRLPLSCELTYKIVDWLNPPVAVFAQEISCREIVFITTAPLAAGTKLDLSLLVTSDSDPVNVRGTVFSQEQIASKFLFRTTVRIENIDEQCNQHLFQFLKKASKNIKIKREFVRCPLVTQVRWSEERAPECVFSATSGDISAGGMKIFTERNISLQATLRVSFELTPVHGSVQVEGAVVWEQKRMGALYIVGGRFVRIRPYYRGMIVSYINSKLRQ